MNKYGQLADYLLDIMPSLNLFRTRNNVDSRAADALYAIWKDDNNKVSNSTYKRPTTFPGHKVDLMSKEGLIKEVGEKLEITDKGASVIKTMVLGDDSSVFDDKKVDYLTAEKNTRTANSKGKKLAAKASDQWWGRFLR